MVGLPLRDDSLTAPSAVQRVRLIGRLVRDNVGLLIFSFALSLLLWLVVQNDQNPPRIDVMPSTLVVEPRHVPAGFSVYGIVDPISVRIAAPGNSWDRLRASSFRVSVDLTGAHEGVGSYVPNVQVSDPNVRVVEVIPDRVDIRLEPIVTRLVAVRIAEVDAVPLGFRSQPPRALPAEATIIGPAPLVGQVDSAVAEIRLDGIRLNVSEEVKLQARNAQGQAIDGVRIEPEHATVEVTVEQQLHYRTVSVVPQVSGEPSSGFWLRSVTADPATVTIAGERTTVQDLTFLNTVLIDVNGVNEAQARTVRLALPPGVSSVDGPSVRVRILVGEITGTRFFSLVPRPINAGTGTTVSAEPIAVEVTGALALLQRLQDAVTIEIDVQNLGPGVHQVAPVARLPDGVRLATPLPERITITVR